jgi:cysteine-rich repeat protein
MQHAGSSVSRLFLYLLMITAVGLGPMTPLYAQEDETGAIIAALQQASSEGSTVSIHPATGRVRFVRFAPGAMQAASADVASAATAFLSQYGAAFGLRDPAKELTLQTQTTDHLGATHLLYHQVYAGVPVFGGELRLHFAADGALTAANGTIIPDLQLDVTPQLAPEVAAALARQALAAATPSHGTAAASWRITVQELLIWRAELLQGQPGPNHLVYEVLATQGESERVLLYIDAQDGKIVEQVNGVPQALQRRVYKDATSLDPALLVWQEGDPVPYTDADPSDQSNINKIIDYTEDTYNFFASLSGGAFLSWNGSDGPMPNLYDSPTARCPNASWSGQAVNYCVDVVSDDLVAHEWAHGYTQSTHGLVYQWQPGALNEAYSDIWGETVDLLNNAGSDTPNTPRSDGACTIFTHTNGTDNTRRWLAFEDGRGFGQALRDLWNPGCFGDPGKVSDTAYACGSTDDGGVHTNSGIPNHAFALLVDGGGYNGQRVRGIGLTKAANLYWRAQTVYHTRTSDFADHADALEQACSDLVDAPLYTPNTEAPTATPAPERITTDDCTQLRNVIAAVELRSEPERCRFPTMLEPTAPPLCQNEGAAVPLLTQDWESGLANWRVSRRDVVSPTTFSTADWAVVGTLPDARAGQAAFVENSQSGNGITDIESGVLILESPTITLPIDALAPRLAFDHWFATEAGRDGGNVKISVNGGPWTLLPSNAFAFNPYNGSVRIETGTESAFSGTNYATFDDGSWGQSRINLRTLAQPGDAVRFRFEFVQDGAGGIHGWYVDDLQAYYCQSCGNGLLNEGEVCDDGNGRNGDGCSNLCQIEPGWFCKAPVSAVGTQPAAPSSCLNLTTAACQEQRLAIPDNTPAGATSIITIPEAGTTPATISDLDVYVEAQHGWLGDLSFVLKHVASGQQVMLVDRPGSLTPGAFGCSGNDLAVLFDDESVLPAENSCAAAQQPGLAGNFLTGNGIEPALQAFDGKLLAGQWALTVADHAPDETGALVRWCLVPSTSTGAVEDERLFLPLVGR